MEIQLTSLEAHFSRNYIYIYLYIAKNRNSEGGEGRGGMEGGTEGKRKGHQYEYEKE